MILKTNIDDNQYKTLLVHYKKFLISAGIILSCVLLFIFVIIPQIQQYNDQRAQTQEVEDRISILEKNITIINSINDQEQDSDLENTVAALPQDKDYAGILYAVKSASSRAGVGVGDFSFSVGELSAKSVITKNVPTLSLSLHLLGAPLDVTRFISEISQTLPLSNISEISVDGDFSLIVIQFYYKPVPQLQIRYSDSITKMSPTNLALLQNLRDWKGKETIFDIALPTETTASASASPFGL